MSGWGLRAKSSYPWHSDGAVLGVDPPMTREEAEEVRRAMPNGEHFELVEVATLAVVPGGGIIGTM